MLEAQREQVVKYARLAASLRLMSWTSGNFSARDPATGLIAITPSDYPYEEMTPEDIVVVDDHGRVVEGRLQPSFETPMHAYFYRQRPDVMGVVHVEPPYVNAFGACGREIPPILISLRIAVRGSVPVAPFEESGTEAIARNALRIMGHRPAVILANHGLVTIGPSLRMALRTAVYVEEGARVYYLTHAIGTPSIVPEGAYAEAQRALAAPADHS